jgi:hypothetical protein
MARSSHVRGPTLPRIKSLLGNGAQQTGSGRRAGHSRTNKSGSGSVHTELSAALLASLQIELVRRIERLFSGEDAALWAQRTLVAKNRLSAADGQQVEEEPRISSGPRGSSSGSAAQYHLMTSFRQPRVIRIANEPHWC